MNLNPISCKNKIELDVAVCVYVCALLFCPVEHMARSPAWTSNYVRSWHSFQTCIWIAGGVAGQQQTLTISVNTPSKGYLRKEGESGRYLKTCQWALLPGSVEWQHGNLQGGLAARKSVLKVIVEHSSKKRLHPGDSKLVSVNIEDSVLKSGSEEWHWIWSNFRNVLVNFFARKFSFYI